ncbi:MAG: hypothetical protein ACSW78_06455 [Lachnospiraceae bacterium]|jgi:hypothetical protein
MTAGAFHIRSDQHYLKCGTLIHNFNLFCEAVGGNTELAVAM